MSGEWSGGESVRCAVSEGQYKHVLTYIQIRTTYYANPSTKFVRVCIRYLVHAKKDTRSCQVIR